MSEENRELPMLGVIAYIGFANCPVHGGDYFSHLERVESLDELKKMIIDGLNQYHVDEVMSFDGNDYEVWYDNARHSYIGAKLRINGETKFITVDNGSGKLIWQAEPTP